VVLGSYPTQIRAALGHPGHGLRVDPVGLPAVASVELPRPCGKHRRDVDHDLAGGDELLGEQVAEAVRALDGQVRSGQCSAHRLSLLSVA